MSVAHLFEMLDKKIILRPSDTQVVRLRLHLRGHLVQHLVKLYVGGVVFEMNWDWDVDLMSYTQIEDLIKSEGYHNIKCLWYWNLEFSFTRGLRPLNNHNDMLMLLEDVKGFKVIDIYVEHKVEVVYIEDVGGGNVEGKDEDDKVEEVNVKGIDEDDKVEEVNVKGNDEYDKVEELNVEGNGEDGNEECNVEEGGEEGNEKENVEDSNEESETNPDYNMSNKDDNEDEEDAEDELNLGPDVGVDWTTVLPTTMTEQSSRVDDYSDNDFCDSDVLHTPSDSDVEVDMKKYPTFTEATKLEVCMMFKDKLHIKDAVKEFTMENKKNLVFTKNDKKRMVVKCVTDCPFYIRLNMRSNN